MGALQRRTAHKPHPTKENIMNIRRFTRRSITTSTLGLVVLAGISAGGAHAANPCFEAGPNGSPREVPCPISIPQLPMPTGNAAFDRLVDALGDIALPADSTSTDECELTLADGRTINIACSLLDGMSTPSLDGLGSIVDGALGDGASAPSDPGTDAESDAPADPVDDAVAPADVEAPADETAPADPATEASTDAPIAPESVDEATADDTVSEEAPAPEAVESSEAPATPDIDEVEEADEVDGDTVEEPAVVEASEVAESATQPTGPLPRTGATTMGITLGIALMGLGGGAFAKLAANRRRS